MKSILFSILLLFTFVVENYAQEIQTNKGTLQNRTIPVRSKYINNANNNIATTRSIIYEEGFEGNNSWNLNGDWESGIPLIGPSSGNNSAQCLATNLGANYSDNLNQQAISGGINIPQKQHPDSKIWFSFYEWHEIETTYDEGIVKISIDGGNSWETKNVRDGNTLGNWVPNFIDITEYAGSSMMIMFEFNSDGSVNFPGWYIDNILVEEIVPSPININIISLNSQNFPFIYLNAVVDTFGTGISSLNESNFEAYENNVNQIDFFEVISPDQGDSTQSNSNRLVDVVFIMDNSGSMEEEQYAIELNLFDFVDNLSSSGVQFALGLCRYGATSNFGNPILEDNGILTSDVNYFKNDIWQRNTIDGEDEPGFDAVLESANGFSFRPGAQRVFVIITDEEPDQGNASSLQTTLFAADNSITVFALTETGLFGDFEEITNGTNGAVFDIYSNFDTILDYISQLVANTYIVRYKSSDPSFNGVLRNVDLRVNHLGNNSNDEGSYIPGSQPVIILKDSTTALSDRGWAPGTAFLIQADIIDNYEPFASEATLYYKNFSATNFETTSLQKVGNSDTWEGEIPSGYAEQPGISYYITASDTESTASSPSVDPILNPHQIAILPNDPPVIIHTPISEGDVNNKIDIQAEVTDNTNEVTEVLLFYKSVGDLIYKEVNMVKGNGDNYTAAIPSVEITYAGLEYFIKATDNYQFSSYSGSIDVPYFINTCNSNNSKLKIEIKQLTQNPNKESYEIQQGANLHYYLKIIDDNDEPVKGIIISYEIGGLFFESSSSDDKGIIDIYVKLSGDNFSDLSDDILSPGSYELKFNYVTVEGDCLEIEEVKQNDFLPVPVYINALFAESLDGVYGGLLGGVGIGINILSVDALKIGVNAEVGHDISWKEVLENGNPKGLQINISGKQTIGLEAKFGLDLKDSEFLGILPKFNVSGNASIEGTNTFSPFLDYSNSISDNLIATLFYMVDAKLSIIVDDAKLYAFRELLNRYLASRNIDMELFSRGNSFVRQASAEANLSGLFQIFERFDMKIEGPALGGGIGGGCEVASKWTGFYDERKEASVKEFIDCNIYVGTRPTLGFNFLKKNRLEALLIDLKPINNDFQRTIETKQINSTLTGDLIRSELSIGLTYDDNNFSVADFDDFVGINKTISFSPKVSRYLAIHSPGNDYAEFIDGHSTNFNLWDCFAFDNPLDEVKPLIDVAAEGFEEDEEFQPDELTITHDRTYLGVKEIEVSLDLKSYLGLSFNAEAGFKIKSYRKDFYKGSEFVFSPDYNGFIPVIEYAPNQDFEAIISPPVPKLTQWIQNVTQALKDKANEIVAAIGSFFNEAIEVVENGVKKFFNNVRDIFSRGPDDEFRNFPPFTDFSVLTFSFPDDGSVFDTGTDITINYFYPKGELYGVEDGNLDKFVIISDYFFFQATLGNDTLDMAPNGFFEIESIVGEDDLNFLGFDETANVELFYKAYEEGLWTSMGAANQTITAQGMGDYALGIRIDQDTIPPAIVSSAKSFLLKEDKVFIRISDTQSGVDWANVKVSLGAYYVPFYRDNFNAEIYIKIEDLPKDLAGDFPLVVEASDLAGNHNFHALILCLNNVVDFVEVKNTIVGLYPNPAKEYISVIYNLNEPNEIRAELYDVRGQLILNQNYGVFDSGINKVVLDVTQVPSGNYLLRLIGAEELLDEKKVIVVR